MNSCLNMLMRSAGTLLIALAMAEGLAAEQQPIENQETHPLMPGIRMRELWDPNWPRPLHDRLATNFSPLVCNMKTAPEVWGEIKVSGTVGWTEIVHLPSGEDQLLVSDGRLRLIDAKGELLWSRGSPGTLLHQGDIRSSGGHYLLMGGGPRLTLLDAYTGETIWQHQFEPSYVGVRVRVSDILRELPGQEAAVFLNYGTQGCVINFPSNAEPNIVWQREVTLPDEFNERYDHRSEIELDLSIPDEPLIWNVRRFRCRGFDARTGEMVSTISYDLGGGPQRRNYGPWSLGHDAEGKLLACIVGEQVQTHVHAIRLRRSGENELAWEHYYGEVYKKAPGVAVKSLITADLDHDGVTEIAYTVRDPGENYRSFVRVRDASTGEVEYELADHWGAATFHGVGPDSAEGMLAFQATNGATPSRGTLKVIRFGNEISPQEIDILEGAGLWGTSTIDVAEGHQLLFREPGETDRGSLARYTIVDGELELVGRTDSAALLAMPIQAVLKQATGDDLYIVANSRGQLGAYTWEGELVWQQSLLGSSVATLGAADLDDDGKAELLVRTPGKRLRVYTFDKQKQPQEQADYEHVVASGKHAPVAYDLEGTGRLCLLTPGTDNQGNFAIRAYRGDGTLFWESSLDVGANEPNSCIISAGRFLGADHSAVAVSIADRRLVREGTYLLDGRTGDLMWFKDRYRDGYVIFPFRPHSVATVHDFDGDGTQEVGMDMLCYMAWLRGSDGSFVSLHHTANSKTENALYAGMLYNSFCPIYKTPDDPQPYWTVTTGFGRFGLMKPDPTEGIWREDLQYDNPQNVAMVDTDADGVMEVGYVARNDVTFICRDLWTGEIEWTLELPHAPNSLTITADVDADGKGEFLTGSFCIGTDDTGKGELRWQSPVPLYNAIIADVDGDGDGEIVCPRPGKVVVLNQQNIEP